ncbi:MAG TPA: hypothetical protein VEL05_07910, partial [Candidatus Acidoferrum sp.]|nr:hypothetical protein [Candidatus Acidoferrum sp.]
IRLFLSETRTGKSSSCARAIKAFPELAPLAGTVEGGQVISSFDEGVPGSAARLTSAMVAERAQKLADGVPRSFPLNDSCFFFGPIAALLGSASAEPPVRASGRPHTDQVAGEIALYSHWWITGRRTRLHAAAAEALPSRSATDLAPVSDDVSGLLAAMGSVRRERRRLEPSSPDEREAIEQQVAQAEARLAELKRSWAGSPIAYPHELEPDAEEGGFLPLRAALAETLGPAGYRSRAAPRPRSHGMWVLSKRTARANELELRLNRGPINGRLSARLILCGPLWRHDLGYQPLAPGRLEHRIAGEATARRALANLAAAVAAAESFLVPPLEEIHGDGFAWLTAVT